MTRHESGLFLLVALLATAALVIAAPGLEAQSLSAGRLSGIVREPDEQTIYRAEVRAVDRSSGAERGVVTERDGRFRIDALPEGRYDLHIEALGYVPQRYLDVRVAAGFPRFIDVRLTATTPPVTRVDTIPRRDDAGSLGQWLLERGYADLLGARRTGVDVAGFSAAADANGVEGLPWRFASSVVDGARFGNPAAPAGGGGDAASLALPVRAIGTASAGGLGHDVEIGGTGVGLRATSRRGGGATSFRSLVEGGSASVGAAYQIGGALQGDTAQAVFGLDYQRSERDYWDDAVAVDSRVNERVGVFGRLDWRGSERFAVSARASGGRYTSVGQPEALGLASLYGPSYEGTAGQASLNVVGQLTRRFSHEWRVGVDVGEVTGAASGDARALDVGNPGRDASDLGTPFRELRATPRVSGMLHFDAGVHQLKAGFTGAVSRVESQFVRDGDGLYVFGDAPGLNVLGAWRQVSLSDADANIRMRESAVFVQDDWQVLEGLTLSLGVRFDRFAIPAGGIERNDAWRGASGLDNAAVKSRSNGASPRVGFRWELGRDGDWVLEGAAGTYRNLPDARDIADALTLDRGADVRLGVGFLPVASRPDLATAPVVGRTVTMLAPDFAGSRTNRLSLGVTRLVGGWGTSLTGVYRLTDGLGRGRDLNLPAFEAGVDQDGRRLYGQLQQLAASVHATPRTNRRFAEFDAVQVLEASGFSEYYGATFGLERVRERGLSVMALYTYSQTLDNIVALGAPALSPFPDGLDGSAYGSDWREGRSDLDVPHRAVLAMEWRPSTRFSVAAVYRIRSGLPFTPGFRGGVDANGDGDWRNDPAYVDVTLPGMAALVADYGCLKPAAFARRNACRGDLSQSVDLRAAFQVARLPVGRIDLVLDAVDLVAANNAPLDAALLLVDAGGSLSTNPTTGVTTVPYVVNPGFGKSLPGRSPGVFWRVGLRVTP